MRKSFRSPGEEEEFKRLSKQITLEMKNLIHLGYEEQKLSYLIKKNCIPDFCLSINCGMGDIKEIYLEYKERDQRSGLHIPDVAKKYIAVRDQNGIDLRFIFGQKGYKRSKTQTYEDWCNKHNFKYYYKGEFTLEDIVNDNS